MEITEQEAYRRLKSPRNVVNVLGSVLQIERHRIRGPEIPSFIKKTIAILGRSGEVQTEVARQFNVSPAEVSYCERGKISEHKDDPELKAHIEDKLGPVQDKAVERLMSSLGLMDDGKLEKSNAKDLSTIAANMSRVVANTVPRNGNNGDNHGIQIVVYAPQQHKEEDYRVINLRPETK
jgi:hypothetical protein